MSDECAGCEGKMKTKGFKSVEALHVGAMKALKKAVAKAIAQHEREGVPAVIWRDGKVVQLAGLQSKRRR